MANKGAKKRKDENERHMKRLLYVILISTAIFVLFRLVVFRSSASWKHYMGLLLTLGAFKLSYDQLNKMSKPSYDENGELYDGGFDMSTGGLCGYIHDIIYITAFVQFTTSLISDKFWYLYIVIPAFAFYKLWNLILYPYFFQRSEDEPEDEKSRKKREKMERKAGKPKFSKVRNR